MWGVKNRQQRWPEKRKQHLPTGIRRQRRMLREDINHVNNVKLHKGSQRAEIKSWGKSDFNGGLHFQRC